MDSPQTTPDQTTFRRMPIAGTVLMNCALIALFAYVASVAASRDNMWLLAVAVIAMTNQLCLTAAVLIKSQQIRTSTSMIADIEAAQQRGEPIPEKWARKAEKLLAASRARDDG